MNAYSRFGIARRSRMMFARRRPSQVLLDIVHAGDEHPGLVGASGATEHCGRLGDRTCVSWEGGDARHEQAFEADRQLCGRGGGQRPRPPRLQPSAFEQRAQQLLEVERVALARRR